jgi:ribose 5-phosphate isomerase B
MQVKGRLPMKLAVGSDERTHLTDAVIDELVKRGYAVQSYGPLRAENLPWPDVAQQVAEDVARGDVDEGILFCWTGTGVSIAANKVPGIRAALCQDAETARGARLWNRANVLCLSLRTISEVVAKEILDVWFATPPGTDPTDVACVEKVGKIEKKYSKEASLFAVGDANES